MQVRTHLCAYYYITLIICAELALTLSLKTSSVFGGNLSPEDEAHLQTFEPMHIPPVMPMMQRRGCAGFPCMYSHLGTKAGKASLYKTLAGFIDDCFNDKNCDPGRRKRQDKSKQVDDFLKMPLATLLMLRSRVVPENSYRK